MADELDEVSVAILKYCLDGGRLADLPGAYPTATAYRRAHRLIGHGLLARKGRSCFTTDLGRERLRMPTVPSPLVEALPPLALCPTPVHRAIMELIVAAVVARQHGTRDDHHPSFILVGSTLKWKSWEGKIACTLFDLDVTDHVLLAHAESGRSLLTRRGYAGATVSKRDILSSPLVVIDEYDKADARTRAMAGLYQQGTRVVPYENERLDIKPVPLFLMNPLKGETLQERTGLDDARLRRSVVADLDAVTIPEVLRAKGEELLAEARKSRPIDLTNRRPVDCARFRDAIAETLRRCLSPKALERVDVELVLQVSEGMAAFVAAEEAWIVVLRDLLVVWETLGWTLPGWRLRMPVRAPDTGVRIPPAVPAEPRPPTLREETRRLIAQASGPIPRDLGLAKRVAAERAELTKLAVSKRDELKSMRETKQREAEALDRFLREANVTRRDVAEFVAVRDELKRRGVTWNGPALIRAAQFMAVEGAKAESVIALASGLVAHGIRDGSADFLLKSMPSGMTWEQFAAWLGEQARRFANLQSAVATKAEEEEATRSRAARAYILLQNYVDEANAALRKRNGALEDVADLEAQWKEKATEVARFEVTRKNLAKGNADASAELEQLRARVEKTNARLTTMQAALGRVQHAVSLYAALRAGLLGNARAARAILEGLGTQAGTQAVQELRALVRQTLGDSVVPREDVEAERAQRDAREADLRTKLAAAESRAGNAGVSLEREREARQRAEAEAKTLDGQVGEMGRQVEAIAADHRAASGKLTDMDRALARERTAKEGAEAKVRSLESAANAAADDKKKADAELAGYREKAEAAGRVLPLAAEGKPIPLVEVDARVQRVYRDAIARGASAHADRTIAKAMASKGLLVVQSVTLSKRCAQGHVFRQPLFPIDIEKLRTGEMSGRTMPFLQTPGTGYVSCPGCGARVTVTLSEVLELLGAQPAS